VGHVRLLGDSSEAAPSYEWGEYAAVKRLTALMPQGEQRKAFVDCVLDRCNAMQNLREDILPKKKVSEDQAAKQKKRDAALVTGRKYLERYIYLVLFEGYVCCTLDAKSSLYQPPPAGKAPATFSEWLGTMSTTLYPTLDELTLD